MLKWVCSRVMKFKILEQKLLCDWNKHWFSWYHVFVILSYILSWQKGSFCHIVMTKQHVTKQACLPLTCFNKVLLPDSGAPRMRISISSGSFLSSCRICLSIFLLITLASSTLPKTRLYRWEKIQPMVWKFKLDKIH